MRLNLEGRLLPRFFNLFATLICLLCMSCDVAHPIEAVSAAVPTLTMATLQPGTSRGYLTTPQELRTIAQKAAQNIEPYRSAVDEVLAWAARDWDFSLDEHEGCDSSENPAWIDRNRGAGIVYAKALAYHLTNNAAYAEETVEILQRVMTSVMTIGLRQPQCQLNFGWGTPEFVAAADLIEAYWRDRECTGPLSTIYGDDQMGSGICKRLFQNWLVKNPYYVTSYAAISSQSNWGAAATNATAYVADYLWDRPEVRLIHRVPQLVNEGANFAFSPAEAYRFARQLALDRLNGYGVEYTSNSSCDYLAGEQQSGELPAVKSQITENGIIPEDARREQFCNIAVYNGEYQNYPQIHLNNTIQQCELLYRRGDRSCYDNVAVQAISDYTFVGPDGLTRTTDLHAFRGSIERAINAIIIDAETEWRHDAALEVAYRYYLLNHRLEGVERWFAELTRPSGCSQGVCFGTLTHGFAVGEFPTPPPITAPPSD